MSSSDPPTNKPFGSATNPATDGSTTQLILGQLGQYDLLLKLGEGGMGQVYKARHRLMDQIVALKVIHQKTLDRPDAVERFHREIRALAKLTHPNIVRAQYADHVDGTHFLVMEYVAGPNLADVVGEQGPLPVPVACAYIQQAACGLQHAHEQGMVHRDIKPSNLLVAPGGQVKLLDLGLALIRENSTTTEELTATGQVFGTYDYMAPEQWDDSHGVDIRADLYSLGCTLYFLLTGRPPYGGPTYTTATQKMKAHTLATIPTVTSVRGDAPPELETILWKLLAKDPKDRFKTPQELIDALQPYLPTGPISSQSPRKGLVEPNAPTMLLGSASTALAPPTTPGRDRRKWHSPRSWKRSSVLIPLMSLFVVGACIGGFFLWQSSDKKPLDAGPNTAPPPPLKIVKFELMHTRMKDGEPLALLRIDALGRNAAPIHVGDKMRIEVGLSEAAHSYMLILKPDGSRHLVYPVATQSVLSVRAVPSMQQDYFYPPGSKATYLLENGTGLETFLFVASRKPLPSFEQWHNGHGNLPWKKGLVDEHSWYGDNAGLEPINSHRGEGKPNVEDVGTLVSLHDHLKNLTDIEVFAFITIPVEKRPLKDEKK